MGDWESTIMVGVEGAEAEAVNQRNNKFAYACLSCHKDNYASQEILILAYIEARRPSHSMESQSSMCL